MRTIFERFVFFVAGIALLLCGLALVDFLLHPLAQDYTFHSTLYRAVVVLVFIPLTLLVGFLIIRRVPGNIVGPLLIVWSGSVAFFSIREEIGPLIVAIFFYYDVSFGWLGLFLMLLHFPDGQIYPRSATPWLYRLLGIYFLLTNLVVLSTAYFPTSSQLANPLHLPALQGYSRVINGVGMLPVSLLLGLVLVSPVLRYRKGSPRERQQIKWLGLFAGFIVLYSLLGLIAYPLLTGGQVMNPGNSLVALALYLATSLFPPLAIGVAVLRHHLWDIDLLIRRTLVYSVLTASLTLIFFGSVVVLQNLFSRLIGHQTPVAIVISTLASAALFAPFRRRIQTFIDRRFYRRKYNAERVLANFSATLREEVELEQQINTMLGVVHETMQPDHLSLWLLKRVPEPEKRRSL